MTAAVSNFYASLSKVFRHWLGESTNGNSDGVGSAHSDAPEVDMFIRDRRESLSESNDVDVDRMTQSALAHVDEEQTLREVQALRERMKVRSRQRVPDRAKRTG